MDDIEIFPPKLSSRTPEQARKIIAHSTAVARNVISARGANKGNFMEVNKSTPAYQREGNVRNNDKWNPINNLVNNPLSNKARQDYCLKGKYSLI